MHVTRQAQIAERLQVSQATVSRALRNLPGTRSDVRARVMAAATQLGYTLPTPMARAGSEARTDSFVGVLLNTPNNTWRRNDYLVGMCAEAPMLDISLVLHHVSNVSVNSVLDERNQPPALRRGRISSLVLVYRWPHEVVKKLSSEYRCVSLQHTYPGLSIDVIGVNATEAIDHLLSRLYEQGHRNIGFVGHCASISWARVRFSGYIESLVRHGLDFRADWVVRNETVEIEGYGQPDSYWTAWNQQIVEKVRAGVTAWISVNDDIAYRACSAMMQAGIQVPGDVSICGFDGHPQALFGAPLVESVYAPGGAIGATALRIIKQRQERPQDPPMTVLLECPHRPGASIAPMSGR